VGLLIFQRGIDMPVKVTFSGHNLRKIAKTPKSSSVAAGFFEDSKYPDGTQVAQVATWNEYGATLPVYTYSKEKGNLTSVVIPPRPFMEMAFVENHNKWAKYIQQESARQLKKNGNIDCNSILVAVGEMMQAAIRGSIVNGNFTPNAPSTIAKKGKDTVLRDSVRMLNSVNYQVVKK